MKKTLYVLPVILTLTGCFERENPLLKIEPTTLQAWIQQNVAEEVKNCSVIWAEPEQAKDLLPSCEPMQKAVADKMNTSGLSNAEITPADILLPAVWKTYVASEKQKLEAVWKPAKKDLDAEIAKCSQIYNLDQQLACMNKLRPDRK